MLNQIMEVLTPRRMMSVGNLALLLEIEPNELQPQLDQLEAKGRIRYALSKCAGTCSTCSTGCGGDSEAPEPVVDETAIVISLDKRKEEE